MKYGEITYAEMVRAGLKARRANRREPELVVSIDIRVDDLVVVKKRGRRPKLQLVFPETGTEKKR